MLLTALAGFFAELVDGGLGMGFGVTSTTLLITLAAMTPAAASAVVHTAELGTTAVSGLSHWKFGNVDWKVVTKVGIPGAVGAFAGATLLSNISTKSARPAMALILTLIGFNLIWRFSRGKVRRHDGPTSHSTAFLGGLGLLGGFVDATGGGGWGPVTTSTLLTAGRIEPRKVVGTVNTAEFFVTSAAVVGFAIGLWDDLVSNLASVIALLIGGSIAAAIGAWLVSKLNPTLLGGFVGTLILALNLPAVLKGLPTDFVWAITAAVIVLGLLLSVRGLKLSTAPAASTTVVVKQEPVGQDSQVREQDSQVREPAAASVD